MLLRNFDNSFNTMPVGCKIIFYSIKIGLTPSFLRDQVDMQIYSGIIILSFLLIPKFINPYLKLFFHERNKIHFYLYLRLKYFVKIYF